MTESNENQPGKKKISFKYLVTKYTHTHTHTHTHVASFLS